MQGARSIEARDSFSSRFARYSQYGGKFKKAVDAVLGDCVKKHVFRPSGRVIYTVVGRSGDEFIDPERRFCSCQYFFYNVLGGRDELCYHLLSYIIASESTKFDEIEFHDEEYSGLVSLLAQDLINPLRDKGDKER